MATATQPPQQAVSPADRAPIWPIPIEVFGSSGEFSSGKTLLGLTIDPANTIVYDFEGSATPYKGLGFRHVDVARELLARFSQQQYPNGVSALDRFIWWREHMRTNCPPGKYSVIMVDPISELEEGIVDYVKKNAEREFGLSSSQVQKGGGLLWGKVKAFQKSILDDLRARCQTFYFTAHMRDQFKGGAPTGQREAKGKETLEELATLYLHLDREAPREGTHKGVQPVEPNATLIKTRLTQISVTPKGVEINPILPPRFTHCTPKRIREYMASPPDYSKLKKDERIQVKETTREDELRLELQVAEKKVEGEQLALSRLDMMRQAAMHTTPQPVNADQSGAAATARKEKTAIAAVGAEQPLAPERVKIVVDLAREVFAANPAGFKELLIQHGADKASDLTTESGKAVLTQLFVIRDAAKQEAPFDTPAAAPSEAPLPEGLSNTLEHVSQEDADAAPASNIVKQFILADAREYFVDDADFAGWLQSMGCSSIPDLKAGQARAVVDGLRRLLVDKHGTGVRPSQLARLKELVSEDRLCLSGTACVDQYLRPLGVGSFRSLASAQADTIIDDLIRRELGLPKK